MNEININIEGYNVNGICVCCLHYNRKMFYSKYVKECLRILGNIEVPDGLTVQVCWECLANMKRMCQFQNQIQKAYCVLIEYSRKHTFLDSHEDLSKHAARTLSVAETCVLEYKTKDEIEIEVPVDDVTVIKEEFDDDIVDACDGDDVKLDDTQLNDDSIVKDEDKDTVYGYNANNLDGTLTQDTDEEDVKLSKLKRKKEKRDKRRTKSEKRRRKEEKNEESKDKLPPKSYRKLKNLPEDLVQLVQMGEDQMWEVRRSDVVNPHFVKLKYKCDDCIIGFNSQKLMTDHMAGKHKPKSSTCHQCDVCKAHFLTGDNVSVHRSLHLAGYRCKQCDFHTTLKRLMVRHVAEYHRMADVAYMCTLCKKGFSTKNKLTYHRGVCQQEQPQCDCCGKVFANKMTLKYHLKILPSEKSDGKPKENLYLPCQGCNKVFHSRKSYRAHVVIHEGLEYPCPVCGKPFQWKRNLARHLRNHSERETGTYYECRPCRKRFSSKDCFNNHMRFSKKHVSEDNYVHECNYCGKKFPTKWCMVDHVDWDHLKKIKYQCQICLKAFKTAKIMVAHINNIHEGKKNREPEGEHLCEICGKSYKTVKRLKGHVWAMHTRRSPLKTYKCKLCPATFSWQTSIYKHTRMMHDNPRRGKPARPLTTAAKKLRTETNPYEGLELTNRMQYFQHNLVQNMVQQNVQNPTAGIVPNIV